MTDSYKVLVQTNLAKIGFYTAAIDGIWGAKTWTGIIRYTSKLTPTDRLDDFAKALAAELEPAGINTPLRICHYLAQVAHESGGFAYWKELGGAVYFQRYEGRSDLGNTSPGDGVKYPGRGPIQITGKANYSKYGKLLGLDLVNHPELAEKTSVGVDISLAYWNDKGLSAYADRDDMTTITKRINGGLNGLSDRQAYLAKLKVLFGII